MPNVTALSTPSRTWTADSFSQDAQPPTIPAIRENTWQNGSVIVQDWLNELNLPDCWSAEPHDAAFVALVGSALTSLIGWPSDRELRVCMEQPPQDLLVLSARSGSSLRAPVMVKLTQAGVNAAVWDNPDAKNVSTDAIPAFHWSGFQGGSAFLRATLASLGPQDSRALLSDLSAIGRDDPERLKCLVVSILRGDPQRLESMRLPALSRSALIQQGTKRSADSSDVLSCHGHSAEKRLRVHQTESHDALELTTQHVGLLRGLWPRTAGEGAVPWARRLHTVAQWLRTRPYDERIDLLSRVTGATEHQLRQEPSLRDTDDSAWIDESYLRAMHPRMGREPRMAWARRLRAVNPWLKAHDDQGIGLLSKVTSVPEPVLRQQSIRWDLDASTAQQIEDIRAQWPQERGESRITWSLRLYTEVPALKTLGQDERLDLLSLVTGASRRRVRQHAALLNMDNATAQKVEAIHARWPRERNESRLTWAQRLFTLVPGLMSLGYEERIDLLSRVTLLSRGKLRMHPAFWDGNHEAAQQAQTIRDRWPRGAR